MSLELSRSALLRTQAFIDGRWVDAARGERFEIRNPASGESLATVPDMGTRDAQRAIAAAAASWPDWRRSTAKQRAVVLRRWFELITEHGEDLASLMTAESGKPLAEARGEVAYGASFVEWFAEEGKRAYGDVIPATAADRRLLVIKQPIGVCAAITPWNFPLAMITRKCAPALAAGCPVVVKPAEQTPLTALALAALAEEAGIPPGVLNVLSSAQPKAVGQTICASDVVRKLSFTGSTAVGRILLAQCAQGIKKVSLELGGNAPFIVFDDADLGAAVAGAMASKYRNSGQTCVCANRLLVQSGIYEAFAARLSEEVAALHVGDGMAEGVEQGPLIDTAALHKVEACVQDALDHGARVLTGGSRHALGGSFFQPTVLADATEQMRVAGEEIFGPVAPLFRFETEDEAIALANATEYGLAAYLYSRDVGRIWRVAEALEYGMVGINAGIISTEVAPFGGVKASGIGREGSKYGLDEFLELKYLCLGGLDA